MYNNGDIFLYLLNFIVYNILILCVWTKANATFEKRDCYFHKSEFLKLSVSYYHSKYSWRYTII